MEVHQLEYFVAVAETGSFSRAAERCLVAQPSLSQQIKKLEQEIGQPLFNRSRKGVSLTEAGQLLLPRAHAILAEIQNIRPNLEREVQEGKGKVSVGFIPTIAPFVLPRVIRSFRTLYPGATLAVHEDLTQALVSGLVEGSLDVAITSLPVHHPLIETDELFTETLMVAIPREHLAAQSAELTVRELEQYPFIALSEMHCLGEQVRAFCSQQNLDLQIVCHTSQLSTVQSCVVLGLGISLVPRALAVSDDSGQVVYRQVVDAVPQRKIAAAWYARRRLSFLARELIRLVRQEYPVETQPPCA